LEVIHIRIRIEELVFGTKTMDDLKRRITADPRYLCGSWFSPLCM